MQVDVRADMRSVLLRLGQNESAVTGQAAARALNRAAITVRAEASREIRKEYNLKAAEIKNEISIDRATRLKLRAIVGVKGRRLTLYRFNAKQNKVGVAVTIKRGQRKTIKSAFIAKGKGGNMVVFARGVYSGGKFVPGKPRKPIAALRTTSIPIMFSQRAVSSALERIAIDAFSKNYESELRFALTRAA